MKSLYTLSFWLSVAAVLLILGCSKDYPTGAEFEPYQYSSLDQNAGSWKTVLLQNPEQIVIDAPQDITQASYKSELQALKEAVSKMSAHDRSAINYWTNNPIIRWNEIARELAAKYNLTPAPNPDGTYPAPSAANPGVYPLFPFAHPPYASRAFAYLSVAQFDALIAAWHYKFKYNRPAVFRSDNTVNTFFDPVDLPSYPSDGAVVAAVSRDILSAMFPLEKEYLKEKAEEMKRCLLLSGINVESDLIAGDSLGRGVARVFLARASTDGMGAAQTPRPVSDSLANIAEAQFGWRWINMESPRRPVGITPRFGNVKTWAVPDIKAIRPGVPPAIGSAEFNKAADELKQIANNLTKEQRKIANWWSDGLGTYTPPGHWNRFATNSIIQYRYNPVRSARVYAYMNMAIMDAGIACWDVKYYYNYPRPVQAIPGFKTILGTPNFPAYTSGHSSFSSAAANVLSYIFPNERAAFEKYAKEASESRIYGGIHYRFDCEVGLTQGKQVADFVIQKALADGAN
jgi:hypothetical protein